jgi:hypothetical protein
MMTTVSLRKQCAMDAFQLWLDQQGQGWRVVDLVKPDPPQFELVVTDEPDPRKNVDE